MKIKTEIIRQPAGTYSIWIDGKEESSGWKKLEYAEMHLKTKKVKKPNMIKTTLYQVEALNDGDGWTWNNWWRLEGGIYLDSSVLSSARQLLRFCRDKLQILTEESKGKLCIEDDGYNVCVNLRNGETLFAFCYGENQ